MRAQGVLVRAWRVAARERRHAREKGQLVLSSGADEARAEAAATAATEPDDAAPSVEPGGADGPTEFSGPTTQLRRDGFAIASERYFECLPELREFEALAAAAAAEESERLEADTSKATDKGRRTRTPKEKKRRRHKAPF